MAVARISCICRRCGEEFTIRREFRNRQDADSWESWAKAHEDSYDLCRNCYKLEQDEAAAESNKSDQMPDLIGTPKQIAWAEKIRADTIRDFRKRIDRYSKEYQALPPDQQEKFDASVSACMTIIRSITSASEWIGFHTSCKPLIWWIREHSPIE